VKQHLKQRLPFALWMGLVFLIGFRFGFQAVDTSSGWQVALVGTAVFVVALAPDTVIWLRARAARTR
jgi:hypothetical protein